MKAKAPTSKKPYLLRAMYEWLVDNDFTPHILVDANEPGISAPPSAIRDGRVLLNIAPAAVFGLNLGNDLVSLRASFSGSQREVSFPMNSVLAIYAREDVQQGIVFAAEAEAPASEQEAAAVVESPSEPDKPPERKGRANLRIVK